MRGFRVLELPAGAGLTLDLRGQDLGQHDGGHGSVNERSGVMTVASARSTTCISTRPMVAALMLVHV